MLDADKEMGSWAIRNLLMSFSMFPLLVELKVSYCTVEYLGCPKNLHPPSSI
jgi:hypothetical protein